jgi:hypothetical protein
VKSARSNLSWVFLLLLGLAGLFAGGCASTEPDNMSARPWAAPKNWETGLPGGMMEGR